MLVLCAGPPLAPTVCYIFDKVCCHLIKDGCTVQVGVGGE